MKTTRKDSSIRRLSPKPTCSKPDRPMFTVLRRVLTRVDLGVAWWHLDCTQVLKIVKHGVVVNVAIGVLGFKSSDEIAIHEVEAQNGASAIPYFVDGEGRTSGGGPL
jgi:hypothetical protein